MSTLFLVAGLWMVRQLASGPERAASQVDSLALAIGVVFLIEGAVATVVALTHRQIKGWGWGLTNGVVTLVLGLMILTMKSLSLLWVLGTLVGISFLFSGLDLLTFSASSTGSVTTDRPPQVLRIEVALPERKETPERTETSGGPSASALLPSLWLLWVLQPMLCSLPVVPIGSSQMEPVSLWSSIRNSWPGSNPIRRV
jgi:hypothetical protein